jgi:2-dehydropantoate 2-reductase
MSERAEVSGIAVIGAGAIGGVVAANLAKAGKHVRLCVRRPLPRLVVGPAGAEVEAKVEITANSASAAPAEWVFLATKAQQTRGAAGWLKSLCATGSTVVVLQNGIDHEDRVRAYAGNADILPSIVYIGAERIAPGHIVEHDSGRLVVPVGKNAERLAALFAGSATSVETSHDFLTDSWVKLLNNIFANPITALTMRRAEVFDDPQILALARGLVSEAMAVGRAAGARFADHQLQTTLDVAARLPRDAGSSMFYDRLAGRPLEHEYLTGAVVRAADRLGVDVPLNRAILTLVNALSQGIERGSTRHEHA